MPTQVKVGWRSFVSPVASSYLLDSYSSAAAAYSLRKLRTAYTGSAIRVRRSSDNTEQNIGFDASGNLDTTALLSFVGAGNGFVTTWYDQSGSGNNATQTTASSQPRIVNAGIIETVGGKPAVRWLVIGGLEMVLSMNTSLSNVRSVFLNITYLSGIARVPLLGHTTAYDYHSDADVYLSSQYAANYVKNGSNYINGVSKTLATFVKSSSNSLITMIHTSASGNVNQISSDRNIGRWDWSFFAGYFSEIILYSSDQTTNRINIESNINTYYSIYATDTDAQAFINSASITDGTQIRAIDTLVTSLKTAGIWTKMKALYPFVGGNATSHKFNLKDPRDLDAAYRLVFNGGWVHSSTGALPNGTTGYANTFFNPFNNLSIDNTHMSYYSRTNSAKNSYDMGVTITNTNPLRSLHTCLKWGTGGNTYWSMGFQNVTSLSSEVDLFLPSSAANFLFNKTSSTSTSLFVNNTKYTASVTNRGLPNGNFYLGARNLNGIADLYADRQSAFASIGDGLTDAEATAFYNAVQAFQTSLGRQV